jgi:hypothetical protein
MKLLRLSMLLVSTLVLFSWPIYADTISIGLQEGGASPTTVATGVGDASVTQAFGTFSSVSVTGHGQSTLTPPDVLFSNAINTATAMGGTLDIFITDQGLIAPNGTIPFGSSFTVNTLPSGWTVEELTFVDANNGLYGGAPLSAFTFSSIGTNAQATAAATGITPYSVTEEFIVHATGAGDSNDTIDLTATPVVGAPEPSVVFLLGIGLMGVGLLKRCNVVRWF